MYVPATAAHICASVVARDVLPFAVQVVSSRGVRQTTRLMTLALSIADEHVFSASVTEDDLRLNDFPSDPEHHKEQIIGRCVGIHFFLLDTLFAAG